MIPHLKKSAADWVEFGRQSYTSLDEQILDSSALPSKPNHSTTAVKQEPGNNPEVVRGYITIDAIKG